MINKIVDFMFGHRGLVVSILLLITLFLGWQASKVVVASKLEDLLPAKHEYIKVHFKYKEQLGDFFKVYLMLQVKEGDIYNQKTLEKIKRINDSLDLIKGVDHNLVLSIYSHKIKKNVVTESGVETLPLMEKVPSSQEAIDDLKETIHRSDTVAGVWVSWDEKCALFTGTFIPELLDYNFLFNKVKELQKAETDSNHILYAAGEPMLTGWVYTFQKEIYWILALSIVAMASLLYYYFRNFAGVVVPVVATFLGSIWGLGFCGLMNYNLEPLTLVLPLLIVARGLSHSVQVTERFFECFDELGEVIPACHKAAVSILPPGLLGIATDVIGILLIGIAPIPIIVKIANIASFWCLGAIPTCLILTPILLSYFKPPKNVKDIVDLERGAAQKILTVFAKVGYGKAGVTTFCVGVVVTIVAFWFSLNVRIGDINPGSPILWKDSEYNLAIKEINENFIGTEELFVIIAGKGERATLHTDFLNNLAEFQRYILKNPSISGSLSLADFLPSVEQYIFGGYPKFQILPNDSDESNQAYIILTGNAGPKDYSLYFNGNMDMVNVIVWTKDHMGDTIRSVIATIKNFAKENKAGLAAANMNIQLASGGLGLLAAINETVEGSQLLNLILVMSSVFLLCTFTYRSWMAAIILMIPLNLANLLTMTVMYFMGIGLNINTLPVVSVGVGVGIDYGIYLLSRLCEEYQIRGEYSFETAWYSLKTTGKATFFTATTMMLGVIFFYFFSSLRFQAEMGLLLAIIMVINMLGAFLLIPSLVYVFKPKFLGKAKLLLTD